VISQIPGDVTAEETKPNEEELFVQRDHLLRTAKRPSPAGTLRLPGPAGAPLGNIPRLASIRL
jgi:hypothetical protein